MKLDTLTQAFMGPFYLNWAIESKLASIFGIRVIPSYLTPLVCEIYKGDTFCIEDLMLRCAPMAPIFLPTDCDDPEWESEDLRNKVMLIPYEDKDEGLAHLHIRILPQECLVAPIRCRIEVFYLPVPVLTISGGIHA